MSETESTYTKFKNHLPVLSKTVAIIILVLNIFLPGVGTILLSCIGGTFNKEHIFVGLLQLITSVCVIGWIVLYKCKGYVYFILF